MVQAWVLRRKRRHGDRETGVHASSLLLIPLKPWSGQADTALLFCYKSPHTA